ncbi:MAG: hypothetical protein LQ337_005394 [Flavoplaca oasis]|nr:MAG: hypothetical protein LQ337_005394 [Flavoplaca oasis]
MAGMSQAEIRYQTEHINDDRSATILGTTISMALLSTLAVIGRYACRKKLRVALSYDDFGIVIGLILNLGMCFVVGYSVHFGSGRHLLAVGKYNVQQFLKLSYAFQLLYGSAITAIKLSILLFYARLFPKESTSKTWRLCLYSLGVICIAFLVAGAPTTIFQCIPVSYMWTREGSARCINEQAFLYFAQAYMVATDVAILSLPIPVVWHLRVRRSKKIGVLGIFLLGSFVCITSIVRFFYVGQIVPFDATWTQVNVTIWSVIEPSTGIVSACLPIMGPLLRLRIADVRSLSWFTRTKSDGSPHHAGSAGQQNIVQMPERSAPAATSYTKPRDMSVSDEEMATPLSDGNVGLEREKGESSG